MIVFVANTLGVCMFACVVMPIMTLLSRVLYYILSQGGKKYAYIIFLGKLKKSA